MGDGADFISSGSVLGVSELNVVLVDGVSNFQKNLAIIIDIGEFSGIPRHSDDGRVDVDRLDTWLGLQCIHDWLDSRVGVMGIHPEGSIFAAGG